MVMGSKIPQQVADRYEYINHITTPVSESLPFIKKFWYLS
jgi:hypothetical protein